ncbi:hypothetical protein PHMEG_00022529 [Phytophthora megakarya]|uniref:Uncharacterized protein n=1 Tax=Phytophthora megakarya TaxID=4795 RepID=A0A225VKU0_9STRA|nr:hypothetical protein PHMEG_00022529 [Phytophthora megakarya]
MLQCARTVVASLTLPIGVAYMKTSVVAMRRGPFKIKATLPEDTDSERESQEVKDEGSSDSDAEEKSEEMKRPSYSSSDSSASDSSESEEKPKKNTKKNVVKKDSKKKKSNATRLKRLKRMNSNSGDDDSEAENIQQKMKVENDDTEDEMNMKDEASGSDTDSEHNWQGGKTEKVVSWRKKRDEIVEDSDEEWREEDEEQTEDEDDGQIGNADVAQAKFVMRNITSHVPLVEETAIRRGVQLSGPPLEFATTHLDEYARFCQDPSEILEDYEVLTDIRQPEPHSSEQRVSEESALAQVPRPMVAMAAKALRHSSRKRKRMENREEPSEHALSAAGLLNIARIGEQFGDHFVESLLSANGKALQGILDVDVAYDKRCWSALPTKKKPIANWRFVLEHVRRTKGKPEAGDAVYPPMKQETLDRITKRLQKLYGHTTQHEEYDVFATTNATEDYLEDEADDESE